MGDLIAVFRMNEVSPEARVKIIIKLGEAINYQYASNVTEPLVYELVTQLDPGNKILADKDFLTRAGIVNQSHNKK